MATRFRVIIAFPAAILVFVGLASCGEDQGDSAGSDANFGVNTVGVTANAAATAQATPLFSTNFEGVCSGATVSAATAYDPAGTTHKALFFETYRDGLMDRSTSLPRDWTVQWSPNGDALRAVDLVVCARRTAAREVKMCDGYQTRGRDTQNRVRWHTATYELSVREARTGRQLAQTTTEATDTTCPMFQTFDGDSDTVDGYASVSETTVADFLRPHMTR